ncbi:MAG: hypothetical protein CML29_00125 [Rhizobiales bacterium]|nr:hypothetical protein [Hyphomicrobiales bacterium]MBA70694.1 hypothetical protein [Hyphomicrobiales bacterium]|tara:strand:- start:1183 stop:2778 length:1596 start_codon:yes stop_codon:yes gene_type:complete
MAANGRVKGDTLDAVFSLLSSRNAERAKREIRERLQAIPDVDSFYIHWAEFELSGKFIRGGISDFSEQSTVVVTNSQSDRDIDLLARRARSGAITAGLIEWDEERRALVWFAPYRHFEPGDKMSIRLRGMVITNLLFSEIVDMFNTGSNLTTAEKRALLQLVGGLELREAARIDGVTYETKRSLIKVCCEKLGCSGQKDLVRQIVGQLTHLLSVSGTHLEHGDPAIVFAEDYLNNDMTLIIRRHRSGANMRYFVGGPKDGRPVVLVHGMMFPVILRGVAEYLDRHNIRLYVPLRPGYLEEQPLALLMSDEDIVERGLYEIIQMIEEEGIGPVTLMGNSLGSPIATGYALGSSQRHFSSLVLLSTNLARPGTDPDENSAFYKGMHDLKSDSVLFKLIYLEYRKFYSNSDVCRDILRNHFRNSNVDIDVMEGVHYGRNVYDMFASTYRSSFFGISEDFRHVMSRPNADTRGLPIPLSIIHGDQDPLTGFDEVVKTFPSPKPGLKCIIPGGGHFAATSHGDRTWAAVAKAAELS